ncbi:hypothetical protein FROZEN_82 [Erwinia phage vB_EamP_Frozen]|uniref:Uncharacterized protein n=2 Tax=Johnsonvirus frozen TaxID=1982578 RepID=A0A191ZDB7_9CAUD|nr:hypothetical protein FROZEN_82 [Erwinia phage vB_EamP_Frozen]ANJ65203.1 hypothetical protein FROZEN_82 [Erwinia phage vB_EamP_Frozen]ANJ65378.1 hypothetical protein GUTMEISTER_74 [Erwinia phage vB_EamP_Gutmeister]
MGLFGSKKKTYVSSVLYNLAGDEDDRPDYLKTTITGKLIADTDPSQSLSDTLQSSYINGPGIRLRSFIKWGESSGYNDLLGVQPVSLALGNDLNNNTLAAQIPHSSDQTVNVQNATIDLGDYTWWADQYMLENHPELVDTDWIADFNEATGQIVITYEDGSLYAFVPSNFAKNGQYIYCSYTLTGEGSSDPLIPGPVIDLGTAPFPDVSDWETESFTSTPTPVTLNKTVKTTKSYSDGRPDEIDTVVIPTSSSYETSHGVYSDTEYQGIIPVGGVEEYVSIVSTQYQDQTGSVVTGNPVTDTDTETDPEGVVITTTTVTTNQSVRINRKYRTDTMRVVNNTFYGTKVFIYRHLSGNAVLDAMFNTEAHEVHFAPFIPIRVDNDMITDDRFDAYYPMATKAYKKATNKKFTEIIDIVKTNDNLGDIDYAYCVFGVSLNVKENACKKYLYKFFESLYAINKNLGADYEAYQTQMAAAIASQKAYQEWYKANRNEDSKNRTKPPKVISSPPLPTSAIQIKANSLMNYNMTISWSAFDEVIGSGMYDSTHKVGDLWFVVGVSDVFDEVIYTGAGSEPFTQNTSTVDSVTLFWQVSKTQWKAMKATGLNHNNKIYGGKSVSTSAKSAINDDEESGFVIPIQQDIYSAMSLVDSTQMATACMFIVFNCYQVVKQKWYQSSIFKIVLIIVIIVVSFYTAGTASGLLGTAIGVGTAVGLTGVAAIIVGTILNALAAMILLKLLQLVGTKLFGEKIGAVFAVIGTVVATIYAGGGFSGGVTALGGMANAANIMQLTVAAGNGYAGYMQAAAQETVAKTQELYADYTAKAKSIAEQYSDVFGSGTEVIDPLRITEASQVVYETATSFIQRTLMVGSDVAELSRTLIYNFVDVTTSTNLTNEG